VPATVLVLDSEPLVRSVVTRILETGGYTVQSCGNMKEALEIVKNRAVDLLLTNVYIPGTTGHEAAQFLRTFQPQMRVLMVAGLPDDQHINQRTAADEFYDSFPKPFKSAELIDKVKEMLRRGKTKPSA
jgi:CheY-like chemotaxis protein